MKGFMQPRQRNKLIKTKTHTLNKCSSDFLGNIRFFLYNPENSSDLPTSFEKGQWGILPKHTKHKELHIEKLDIKEKPLKATSSR